MGLSKVQLTMVLLILTCGPIVAQTAGTPQTETSTAGGRLTTTQWRLVSFSASGTETPVIEGTTITLKFGADGRAGGSGGCNSYSGEYREQGDSLSFSKIISTKRACLDQRANQQVSSSSPIIA